MADVVHYVPAAVAAALSSGRPELLKLGKIHPLSEEEVRGVYGVLGDLITDNYRYRREVERLSEILRLTQENLESALQSFNMVINTLKEGADDEPV